jgi:hypothetical protein
MMMMVEE